MGKIKDSVIRDAFLRSLKKDEGLYIGFDALPRVFGVPVAMDKNLFDELNKEIIENIKRLKSGVSPDWYVNQATHEELDRMLGPTECSHEWVTWTGLHGTVTDCTKCKEIKK